MSEAREDLVGSSEPSNVGPDYFSYYACSVKTLLSQLNRNGSLEVRGKEVDRRFSSLFSNSLGAGISDSERERLRLFLWQGVNCLSAEANEMLEPVLGIKRLKSQLKSKKHPSPSRVASPDLDAKTIPYKKRKRSSSFSSTSLPPLSTPITPESSKEVDDDLQLLMENDSSQVEETVKRYSDEFAATLEHMKMKLEELLDTVISTCRPMTIHEKNKLGKLLEALPAENLDRVVEIIKRGNVAHTNSSDEIHVDLEKVSNVTLWRLYYCVEAVENAKKLVK